MNSKKRLAALTMCVLLVLTVIVSSAYIAINADHDCIGHGCDVCVHMAEAAALMNSFALLCVFAALLQAFLVLNQRRNAFDRISLPVCETLVGRKVRLNN